MSETPKARIAVVDDDALLLAMISDSLEEAGYAVTVFRTAEEALSGLWETGTDLLITDVLLPRMSGLDLAREIRNRPWGENLAIIAVSALQWGAEQVSTLRRTLHPGAILSKPVHPGQLLALIEELLETSAVHEAPLRIRWPSRTIAMVRPSTSELSAVGKERVRVQVSLETARELVAEYSQSLMHDGIFVPSYHPLELHTEVEVQLTLPFRASIKVSGKVVQSIDVESPEGLTRGPGMAIALYDLPKDVKREIKAYVAGVRAGTAGAGPRRDRVVVLAKLWSLQSATATNFLLRSGVRALHVPDLAGAVEVAKHTQPALVAVHGSLLDDDPRPWLAAFHSFGVRLVIAVADGALASRIPRDLPFVRIVPPGPGLEDSLAASLEVALRSAARVPLPVALNASRPDGAVQASLDNVSLGGILLVTESPCAVGERMQVSFDLPGEKGSVRAVVRTLRVARTSAASELKVAASFERIDADSIEVLRRYIEARVGADAYRYLGESLS